ncbi:putative sulfate/molybdate transporter [Desulforhopalus singaporensis]|uniref:Sulfate permease, SulP family n=1 Tax=Desulforhopalus singaporensis TaxID=91360 RepID=A0A1H0RLS7_9BACT|nr:putative sulfate/molybdate transporter [Desulforhopalus singaporensis]SDP29938.1 sulfate permease, SulP family [Desulforhopalus singaporensis]
MSTSYRFDRMEFAGSLGDLGTLLPLVMGMVLVNGVSVTGIFYSIALFYIFAGLYFAVPVPVQPMKAIGAYAIATGVTASQISASAGLICLLLALIGCTGTIDVIGRLIAKPVVRGIQLSTGILLMVRGIEMVLGNSSMQLSAKAAEPFFVLQDIGGVPLSIILGTLGLCIVLSLLGSKRYPAALVLILSGVAAGLLLIKPGLLDQLRPSFHLPQLLPFGIPVKADLTLALFVLVLPQLPMTLGNAIVANADLSHSYFGESARKITYRSVSLSMALANALAFLVGGIPLCHGAGGLAAHYKFGARTGGSNLIIGALFLVLAISLGPEALTLLHLVPFSILGVLLIFAGCELCLTILDITARKEMFVVFLILAVTLASNLAWGFGAGILLSWLFRSGRFSV